MCHSHDGRSGLRFPGQNGRSGAIFPSDVDTDENHQFRPLTMDMQQNSDISGGQIQNTGLTIVVLGPYI